MSRYSHGCDGAAESSQDWNALPKPPCGHSPPAILPPMPRVFAAALWLATSLCAAQSPAPPPNLAAQIAQILSPPELARDHWGVYVTTLDGTPVYALNEAQLFQPASNAKLFTTAAAVALLGPEQTVTTR